MFSKSFLPSFLKTVQFYPKKHVTCMAFFSETSPIKLPYSYGQKANCSFSSDRSVEVTANNMSA